MILPSPFFRPAPSRAPQHGRLVSIGLGSESEDLPEFVVLVTKGISDQPLYARLWGAASCPRHQGVQFRSGNDRCYICRIEGYTAEYRRQMLASLKALNECQYEETGDPEIFDRIAQYEMAYRMQVWYRRSLISRMSLNPYLISMERMQRAGNLCL